MPRPTTYPSTTEVFPNRVYGLVGQMKSLWGKCRSDIDDATNRPDHRRRSSSPTTPTTAMASRVKDKRPYKKSQQFQKISRPPYHLLTMYFSRVFTVFALLAASADAFMGQPMGFASRPTAMMSRTSSSSLNMVADDAKVVLVTGSSRGLGKSIALDIGKAGQKVVINYVSDGSKESAEEVVAEIKAAGGDAVAIQADSSKPDEIKKLFDGAVEAFGTVDVLVNNAGITRDGLVLRMKPEQWQSVIDINLSGVFYCTQAFFKLASKKRTGRIVNISSVVGQIGNPGQANYAAAKGGVMAMSMSNAKEFASRGITVNTVCPGYIATDMVAQLDAAYLEKVSEMIPLKRLGKPEEVAGMVRFLALDPAADYITGHTFNVDGGIAIGA